MKAAMRNKTTTALCGLSHVGGAERKTQIVIQAGHVEQSLRRPPPLEEVDRRSGHQVRTAESGDGGC